MNYEKRRHFYETNKKIVLISLQGMAISCMIYTLIGIAFSAPSEIYNNEKLPFPFQFLFHMGIGCSVYFITALYVGWLPVRFGIGKCILIVLLQLSTAFLIWLCFASHYRRLAKSMNEKIRQNAADENNIE